MMKVRVLVLMGTLLLFGNAFGGVYDCVPTNGAIPGGNGIPKDFLNVRLDTSSQDLVVKAESLDVYGSCGKKNIGKFSSNDLKSLGGGIGGDNYVFHKEYVNLQQVQVEDITIYFANELNDRAPYMYIDYSTSCIEGRFQVILTCKKIK